MSREFLDDYANKLLEVHEQPGEVLFWLNDDRLKFKIDPRITSVEFKPIEGEPTKVMMVVTSRDLKGATSDAD
jgi:hypothetical protein